MGLMMAPSVFLETSRSSGEPLTVGIMLTEGAHGDFVSMVVDGIQDVYGEGDIAMEDIGARLNISAFDAGSGSRGVQYDTEDFNDRDLTDKLRSIHHVDALVFVTQHDINTPSLGLNYLVGCTCVGSLSLVVSYNRFVQGDGTWGPAGGRDTDDAGGGGDTTDDPAEYLRPLDNPLLVERMEKLTAHEFGHLLGLTHRLDGSVMTYRPAGQDVSLNSRELAPADSAEVPLRVEVLKHYSRGDWHGADIYGLNLLVRAVQFPFFAAMVLVAGWTVPFLMGGGGRVSRQGLALGTFLAFAALLVSSPGWALVLPWVGAVLGGSLTRLETSEPDFYRRWKNARGLLLWCGLGALAGLAAAVIRAAMSQTGGGLDRMSADPSVLAGFLGIFTTFITVRVVADMVRVSQKEAAAVEEGTGGDGAVEQ
jgi:predicted Zn-dependent protease